MNLNLLSRYLLLKPNLKRLIQELEQEADTTRARIALLFGSSAVVSICLFYVFVLKIHL